MTARSTANSQGAVHSTLTLVQALGYQAIKSGFTVLYRSIFDVVRDFLHDEALGGQDKVLMKYLKPDLAIIDDMGMKPVAPTLWRVPVRDRHAALPAPLHDHDLQPPAGGLGQVDRRRPRRHPRSSTASCHNADVISITGKSYRMKDRAAKKQTCNEKAK